VCLSQGLCPILTQLGARRAQAVLAGAHELVPEFPLLDVGLAEPPVFLGPVDAIEKALALFFLGKVQEECDDPRAVAISCTRKSSILIFIPIPSVSRTAWLARGDQGLRSALRQPAPAPI
jgi:hypothetical protein